MPQALLETGHEAGLVARLDIDHPVWPEPRLAERRREQVRAGHAPEHLTGSARGDPGGEERRRGAVNRAVSAARDLVQGAKRQTAAGENRVERRYAERQSLAGRPPVLFERANARPEGFELGGRPGMHIGLPWFYVINVPETFWFSFRGGVNGAGALSPDESR